MCLETLCLYKKVYCPYQLISIGIEKKLKNHHLRSLRETL